MDKKPSGPHLLPRGSGKWVACFALILAVLVGAGIWFFKADSERIRRERHEQLSSIGKIKTQRVAAWRTRALEHVAMLAANPIFAEYVPRLASGGEAREKILAQMEHDLRWTEDDAIALFSPEGEELLFCGPIEDFPGIGDLVDQSATERKAVLSPLLRNQGGNVHIASAAPVFGADGRLAAVLAIRIDPTRELFPLVEEWPGRSKTAETLLVERDGDEVVFLTKLRYRPEAPLLFRTPVAQTDLPAAQAVSGKSGEFQGLDYRGVKVVADLRDVPGSPWFMVAKQDSAEAYADLYRTMDAVILVICCLALSAGVAMYGISREGQFRFLRELDEQHKVNEKELQHMNAELESRVAQRTAQLAASNRELEAFAYSISHDLRSPLRAIEGFSAILVEDYGPALDEEARRLLGVVRENAQKMDRLILGILDLSRVSRAPLDLKPVDMAALARSAWEEVLAEDKRSRFEFVLPPLPTASGDPVLLRQVWLNLLSNAAKYSAKSEIRRIEVGASVSPGFLRYFVKDSGAGFDPAYTHKLFGLFQRLHKATEFEGLGIGLANVQKIIQRHGGTVEAEGHPGEGATFAFSLPDKAAHH